MSSPCWLSITPGPEKTEARDGAPEIGEGRDKGRQSAIGLGGTGGGAFWARTIKIGRGLVDDAIVENRVSLGAAGTKTRLDRLGAAFGYLGWSPKSRKRNGSRRLLTWAEWGQKQQTTMSKETIQSIIRN